jgi:hypothetical protein
MCAHPCDPLEPVGDTGLTRAEGVCQVGFASIFGLEGGSSHGEGEPLGLIVARVSSLGWLVRGGVLLALGSAANPCRGETKQAYRLQYAASESCPERVAFAAMVDAKLVESGEHVAVEPPQAGVVLTAVGPLVQGRVELATDDGRRYVRELTGNDCAEVARGLAFVLAYALGTDRNQAAATATPTHPTPSASPPRTTSGAGPAPRRGRPAKTAALARDVVGARWRWGATALIGARSGIAPIWTPTEAAALDLRRRRTGIWAPAFRAGLWRAEPVVHVDRFGATEFEWFSGRAEVCPLEVPLIASVTWAPCLAVHAGRITATGSPRAAPGAEGRRARELWLDATASSRLSVGVWDVLALELNGELGVPFVPYRFAFDPEAPVYDVPALGWAAQFAVGVHFP